MVQIENETYRNTIGADPVALLLGLAECTGPRRRWDRDLLWPIEGPRHSACWLLAWGGRAYPPGLGPHVTQVAPLPATDPGRVRWFSQVRFTSADATAVTTWTEVVRTEELAPGVARCERIATYLRVLFLDGGGGVVGEFRTVTDTDPALSQIDHLDPLVDPLRFAWALVADTQVGQGLYVGLEAGVPTALGLDGVPVRWSDLRYSWGSRYTMEHTIVTPNATRLRLFVGLTSADPARYRITAGGQLAGIVSSDTPAAVRVAEGT